MRTNAPRPQDCHPDRSAKRAAKGPAVRLLLAAAVLAVLTAAAQAQTPTLQISPANRTISLTASDTAEEMATVATVSIGFQVYGPDEQSTYAAGSKRSNAIVRALRDAGIKDEQIESQSQNLSATPVYNDEQKKLGAFQIAQSWTVKTSAEAAANVLHIAVLAGANSSGNINWDVADGEQLQAKAASKALARAQATARTMAEGLGVRLGPLVYASNELPEVERPRPMLAMRMDRKAAAPEPLAINPQRIEKSATVTAIFAIE